MTVDVAPLLRALEEVEVVLAGEKADVVDHRDARREELDRTRERIGGVIVAERGVVGGVHLVDVEVVVGLRVVDLLDVGALGEHLLLREVHGLVGQEVLHVDDADAVVRVEGRELVLRTHLEPMLEVGPVAGVERVQHHDGQREVIDPVALVGDLHLDAVVLVDLGEDHRGVGALGPVEDALHGAEQLPGVRLDEEAVGADPLRGVREGVKPHDRGVVRRHVLERLAEEALRALGAHVDVDLLVAERAPDLLGGAVRELRVDVGGARLALVDEVDLLLGRLATGPEVLVADEEVRELGRVLLGEKVLEVGALPRDVVDHEVEHEVALLANAPHVVPGAELLIDDVVAHGGEAAVGRAREEGQDMNAAHGLVEVLVEHLAKVGEVATQAVRVRDEHDLVVELHGLLPCVWWVSRKPRRLGLTSERSIVPGAAGHDV